MGANEKHAATYHGGEYTPTTEQVREACILGHYPLPSVKQRNELGTDFDRWLETVRTEAKGEALREAAAKLEDASVSPILCWDKCGDPKCRDDIRVGAATEIQSWLRARANQYKEEPANGR